MYAKLVFRNARRSVKDYLIYIVTMTICVTLFYAFLSISSSYYNPDIGSEYDVTLLGDGLKAAICMVTCLVLFLIRFVNHYMLRRRQKEFAIQAVMGMEQKTIGRIFFAETLIMGIISILIGILLGVFCSQFMTAMLLTTYGKPFEIVWTLFPDTVLLTICFFVFSFFLVGMGNRRTIQKAKVIEMLSADKENEPGLKKRPWILGVVILFEAVSLWALVTGVQKVWFYYDPRFALPVRLMFWGNLLFPFLTLLWSVLWLARKGKREYSSLVAGLLACCSLSAFSAGSVAALTNQYYLALGSGMLNQYLQFVLIDLLFLVCGFIYLASGWIVAWKEKSPEHRYHEEALFFFGQITSKLNTTSKTMAVICMTLALAIFLFIATPVLTSWASGYLDVRAMYDVQVFSRYNNVYEEENLPKDDYGIITEFLAEHGIDMAYECTFNLYLPEKGQFHNRIKYDFPVVAISLSDYNRIREMLGYEQISLAENEFTTQWKSVATKEEKTSFLAEHTDIVTDGGTLHISPQPYHEEAIGQTAYNTYTNVLYVFPDKVCGKLLPVMRNRYITTTEKITYEDALELEKLFMEGYPEQTTKGASYGIRFRTLQINSTKANNFILQAAMLYGAVVLMVICLTVLSLQQLLDAGQYQYRFGVLRKLGVEEKRIEKLVLKQLGVWFGLPIIVAVAIAAVVTGYFVQTISAEISAYIGFTSLMVQIGATVGLLAILLVCYFLSTWILFRRSING